MAIAQQVLQRPAPHVVDVAMAATVAIMIMGQARTRPTPRRGAVVAGAAVAEIAEV